MNEPSPFIGWLPRRDAGGGGLENVCEGCPKGWAEKWVQLRP